MQIVTTESGSTIKKSGAEKLGHSEISQIIDRMEPDELITIRVQYLVDSDPFNSLSMYPIPSRAPVFSFASAVPLATQLGALLRHLGAPQRVSNIKTVMR